MVYFLFGASAAAAAGVLAGVDLHLRDVASARASGFWRPARRQALRCRYGNPQRARGRPRGRSGGGVGPKEVAPRRRRARLSSVNSRFFLR